MKVVVQRVAEAHVSVDGTVLGAIERGVVLLVGFAHGDSEPVAEWMARKIVGLRLFPDARGSMNADLADVGGRILAVPQFTLLGDCRKGRRPSFAGAMPPADARRLFERFVALLDAAAGPVATGRFGADMRLHLVNDGPVTVIVEHAAAAPA